MSGSAELSELEFLTDHEPIRKAQASSGSSSGLFGDQPPTLMKPHWKKGSGRNHPTSFTKGSRVAISLSLSIPEPGAFTIEGKGSGPYLQFRQPYQGGTSHQAVVKIASQAALPQKVTRISETIKWTLIDHLGHSHPLGTTGPHEVFVLWGKPITKNSENLVNALTYKRLRYLTDRSVAGDKSDFDAMVMGVHLASDGVFNGNTLDEKVRSLLRSNVDNLWKTVDAKEQYGGSPGQCGEAAALMEVMLRLLGVMAISKHVYASADRSDMATEKNTSYYDNGQFHPPKVTGRRCRAHLKDEKLWMNFSHAPGSFNLQFGEGCCWVEANKSLYPKLVGGKVVGKSQGGRSAVHDLMTKLQNAYKTDKFLVWAAVEVPCDTGPFPKVPP